MAAPAAVSGQSAVPLLERRAASSHKAGIASPNETGVGKIFSGCSRIAAMAVTARAALGIMARMAGEA